MSITAGVIFNLIQDALSKQSEALTREQFLFPTTNLPDLLGNLNFTESLDCMANPSASNLFSNISCTSACGSVENIFANWPNFYTCSWYPSISDTLNNSNVNVTTAEIQTLDAIGIFGNQSALATSISSSIANCLNDYCESSSTCLTLDHSNQCSLDNLIIGNGSSQRLNRSSAVACLRDSVCATTTDVNPDIGGLGVILSLLIQYSISIFGLLLHAAFYIRYRIDVRIASRIPPVQSPNGGVSPAKKRFNKHLEALTSALVEFQKSQCFFAATLQIASLIIVPEFQTGEHLKDEILIRLTSANAFAPIMLTLTHIDSLGGRSSIYVLLLSFVTFVLGTATYWLSLPQYGGGWDFLNYTPPSVPIMSCGNISPFAPCYVQNQFFLFDLWPGNTGIFYSEPQRTGLAVWIISLAILSYRIYYAFATSGWYLQPQAKAVYDQMKQDIKRVKLEISKFIHSVRIPKPIQRLLIFWNRLPTTIALKAELKKVKALLKKRSSWLYIQLFFGTVALLMQFGSMIQVLILSADMIAMQMSFGQIVAVGIWIPVLLEYGYLEIVGAEEGTEYRLKTPLVVSAGVTAKPNAGP